MRIRRFHAGEEPALCAVFHSSVHELARGDYTPTQLEAWAPSCLDEQLSAAWRARMQAIAPFVVETDHGDIAGYGDLQPTGYIDHFYVSGRYARQGVGTLLMQHLLSLARAQRVPLLTSDVSVTAQPFFERFGFRITERKLATVRGVAMPNARMELCLVR